MLESKRKNSTGILLLTFSLSLVGLGLLEISFLPYQGTWGSDAIYYYKAATDIKFGLPYERLDGAGFIYYQSFILKIISAAWAPSLLLLCFYIFLVGINIKLDKSLILLQLATIANPIILWTIARGMKEGLIVVSLLFIYTLSRLKLRKKFKTVILLTSLLIFAYMMSFLRPLGGSFIIITLIAALLTYQKFNSVRLSVILLLVTPTIISTFILFSSSHPIAVRLLAQRTVFLEQTNIEAITELPLISLIRFLLGPGPIQPFYALFGNTNFLEPTNAGLVLITIGSMLWWLLLFKLIGPILNTFRKNRYKTNSTTFIDHYFSILLVIHTITYTVVYGGMVDTRHRALVYLACYPIAKYLLKKRNKISLR